MFWTQTRPDNRTLALVLGSLVVGAWLSLAAWGLSPYGRYLDHGSLEDLPVSAPAAGAIFVGGWTLMIVAMMLPTAYPVVALFRGVIRERDDGWLLMSLCVVGYLAVWGAFGAVAYLADVSLHQVLDGVPAIEARPWVVGAAVFALAGAYQFAPLKYRCLERCRSPRMFVLRHWTGRRERPSSVALGVDSGVFCVGCCWSLMLLMFAVGAGSLPWMLLLGSAMAIEKNVSWGDQISKPLGGSLLFAAAAILVRGVLG